MAGKNADWGRRHPSDLNDEAPQVEVITDLTGNISSSTNPVGRTTFRTCCVITDQALKMAQRALEQAERALAALRNVANQQQQEPPDTCGGACTAIVVTTVRRCTTVKKPSGQVTSGIGQSGQMVGSEVVGTICYTFNSVFSAKAFAQTKIAAVNERNAAYGFTIPKVYEFLPQFVSSDLGTDPATHTPCHEPDADKRALTGKQVNVPDSVEIEP